MPKLVVQDLDVPENVSSGKGKAHAEREPLRQELTTLVENKMIRLTPDEGESMRKLKRMVTEAAKEVDRTVKYVEHEGDLLVFIPDPNQPRSNRGRKPKAATE